MADHTTQNRTQTSASAGLGRRVARLLDARWVLLVGALLLFLLALTERLNALEALALLAVVAGITLLLPSRRRSVAQDREVTVQSRETRDETLNAFADALESPCILISERAMVVHVNPIARRQFPNMQAGSPLAFSLRYPALLAAIEDSRNADAAAYRRTAPDSPDRIPGGT